MRTLRFVGVQPVLIHCVPEDSMYSTNFVPFGSVSAPADETIGYAWEYTIRDERLISCTYNSLDDETADRKLQGFTFKAQRPGRTVIELTYAQAWSGGTIDKLLLLSCRVDEDLTVTAEFL